MTQTSIENYPQIFFDSWWEKTDASELKPGRLVWAFVPHVDQVPKALVAKGRTEATQHSLANCEIVAVNSDKLFQRSQMPVAALPAFSREVRTVYNAKKRPVLILSGPGVDVHKECLPGKPQKLTIPTIMVAPYYGRDEGTGRRAGYPQPFIERVAKCEWPQFFWDQLPLGRADESLLRIDHLIPMSTHYIAYDPTPWTLSQPAIDFMHEYVHWYFSGEFLSHETAQLKLIRSTLMAEPSAAPPST